jgi:uncharacterized protein (DUF934 family)
MTGTLLKLEAGTITRHSLPEGAFKPARAPVPVPDMALVNAGQGDTRGRIVPKVAWPDAPGVTAWERGALAPLATWREHGGPAVVLIGQDDPMALAGRLEGLKLIAIDFARATDGRGLSNARLLRDRLGWAGELRAVGDVLIDQLAAMARCGFSSFALRGDQDGEAARAALAHPVSVYRFANAFDWASAQPLRAAG